MKLTKLASLLLAVLMLLSSMGSIALAEEPVTLTTAPPTTPSA